MNHKIGRNDFCSCGSGKKYKKCCLMNELSSSSKTSPLDFKWRQLRNLEGTIIDHHLLPFATRELPEEIMGLVFGGFLPEYLSKAEDQESLFQQFFIPWFLFNWVPHYDLELKDFDFLKTIAENYLHSHENHLNSEEKRFIKAMTKSYYSYYSVLDVEFEKSFVVKDILLGTTHTVKERQGTHYIKPGHIVFGRILTIDNQSIFIVAPK